LTKVQKYFTAGAGVVKAIVGTFQAPSDEESETNSRNNVEGARLLFPLHPVTIL
jgi:hypothetical protein